MTDFQQGMVLGSGIGYFLGFAFTHVIHVAADWIERRSRAAPAIFDVRAERVRNLLAECRDAAANDTVPVEVES
jgi:hypothetical protein